jgi:hypothetical protein
MKTRLMLAGGLLLALTGCTTYDYVGGGRSGSYYHGAPSVEYRYPAGYPYNYGYPYYGGYGGYYGGYGNPYYSRPIYRPPHNHRPPPPARQRWREPSAAAAAAVVQRRFAVAEHGLDAPPAAVEHPAVGAAAGPSGPGAERAEDERFPLAQHGSWDAAHS